MFKLQSKSDSSTLTEFLTLEDVKWWFDMLCNIPSNWKVICPDGTVLLGEHYESWQAIN